MTFGLKNKNKSKKIQQQIESMKKNAKMNQMRHDPRAAQLEKEAAEKRAAAKKQAELNALLRASIVQPTVPEGHSAKEYTCEFWKFGLCTKGDKCKYAHTNNPLKPEDAKRLEEQRKKEEEEAASAQDKKNAPLKLEKLCPFFIAALRYGNVPTNWKCPDQIKKGSCKYSHEIPKGFVLKKTVSKNSDGFGVGAVAEEDCANLEEEIERRRAELGNGTPVTEETFKQWKIRREELKASALAEQERKDRLKEEQERKMSKFFGRTGRNLFEFNPELFEAIDKQLEDEGDAGHVITYHHKEGDEEAVINDAENNGEGTVITGVTE